jgi:ureidoacrylate peracid hydrolase
LVVDLTTPDDLVTSLLAIAVSALVVVDLQNDYCHKDGAFAKAGFDLSTIDPMIDVVEELIGGARQSGVPVIFLRNIHSDATDSPAWRRRSRHALTLAREGTWGAEFYRVSPEPGDRIVSKHRYSGFVGTRFAHVLSALGRTTLVFAGTATNVCVESTVRHACMLDYDVVVAADGVAASDPDAHAASLLNMNRLFGNARPSSFILDVWGDGSE